jgi:membrane protein DedA with SNARE-associated domain
MDPATVGSITGAITNWLLHFHGAPAYLAVGSLVFAEAALLVGFVVPGETAVVVGGVLASVGSVNLWAIMTVAVLGAVLGDTVGFALGRGAGPWLLGRWPQRGTGAVVRTTALLERYGGAAVFAGRFLTFARAVVPGVAGMSRLRYRTFALYNVLGGTVWATAYTLLGYLVGRSFARIASDLSAGSLVVLGILVVALAGYAWRHGRKDGLTSPVTGTGGEAGEGVESGWSSAAGLVPSRSPGDGLVVAKYSRAIQVDVADRRRPH